MHRTKEGFARSRKLWIADDTTARCPTKIRNFLGLLHAIFALAMKRGWCTTNPVAAVDKPRNPHNHDIRYLNNDELELLLLATADDELGQLERALYLTAAMTGLRRGELLALRWQDVDWDAGVVRVRRTFSRGQFGTPKSRRSSRAVPMAGRVTDALQDHLGRSRYQGSVDLVFAHPELGHVLDPSKCESGFRLRLDARGCGRSDSMTFDTPSGPAWRLQALRYGRSKSGWATAISAPRLIYADYAPDLTQGAMWATRAFGSGTDRAFDTQAR